ncbi:MAG: nucleotidyltransferase family protein [Acidobacteria bacterium]|nr:nucleotidyltransferase family protein [Acidobacteriota bacterium]
MGTSPYFRMMISQILLAAGLSLRMKTSKPLLDFGGVPLLSLLLEECRQSRVDTVVVVLGHEKEKILEQVDFSGAQVVVNSDYRKGQTSSFQCALEAMDPATVAFLNLPVDHPLVTRREIDALIKAYRNGKDQSRIFIPTFGDQEGRPVLFDISLRQEILALGPDEPVDGIIRKFRNSLSQVPVDNPFTRKDMDTPEEYRECLEIFSKRD